MAPLSYFIKFLIALGIGAIAGIERESKSIKEKNDHDFGGVRTYTVVSTLGFLSGLMFFEGFPIVSYIILTITSLLFIGSYFSSVFLYKATGITTELGALIVLVFGFMMGINSIPTELVLALSILVTFILAKKKDIRNITESIGEKQLFDFLKFGIISLVVLPFLPNESYSLENISGAKNFFQSMGTYSEKLFSIEIINPFKIWFIVVFVSSLDLFGFIARKIIGSGKSVLVSALFGGFVSSTSTTQGLAIQSKKSNKMNSKTLAGAAIMASVISFIQILILIAPLSPKLLSASFLPVFLMGIAGTIFSFSIMNLKDGKNESENDQDKTIFSLKPALIFASLLLIIKFSANLALTFLGESAFFTTSVIASFVGVDAIVVTLSELVTNGSLSVSTAVLTLLAVSATNLGAKSFYSFTQGSKTFFKYLVIGFTIIIVTSFVVLAFI